MSPALSLAEEVWGTWAHVSGVADTGGSTVDVLVKHDGQWRAGTDLGITDFYGHVHAYGYLSSGVPVYGASTNKQILASRVGSVLDASLKTRATAPLPFLSTSNGLFLYKIGNTVHSTIREYSETTPTVWHGRVFEWRTVIDLQTGNTGQPHMGFDVLSGGEYHLASKRRQCYRDAIRSAVYQIERAPLPDQWIMDLFASIKPLRDSLPYLLAKESLTLAQKNRIGNAKTVLDTWETLAVNLTDPLTKDQRHQFLAELADAQVTLNESGVVQEELWKCLGPSKTAQLGKLDRVVRSLKIIDAVLKGINLGNEMSRIYYFESLYSDLRRVPQVQTRLLALQHLAPQAATFDQALADAIQDEVTAFEQGNDPGLLEVMVGDLSPDAKQHWYNVIKTGVKMGTDVTTDAALVAVIGEATSIPVLALVAVDAFLIDQLIDVGFDLAEDSQRIMLGNAYLTLDQFTSSCLQQALPGVAFSYPTLSELTLVDLCAASSIGTYAARQAVDRYKAAIQDAGYVGNLIQYLANGYNDGTVYLAQLDQFMAFCTKKNDAVLRETLWNNAAAVVNVAELQFEGLLIPALLYSTACPYGLPEFRPPTISGRITRQDNGQGLDGVTITFSGAGGTVPTSNGGYFANTVSYGWSGTVTPTLNGWQFAPSSRTFASPVTQSSSGMDFVGSQTPLPQIQTVQEALYMVEGTTYGGFGVRLPQNPGSNVLVTVQRVSGDSDINVISGSVLSFNAGNWQINQYAQIKANEDSDKTTDTAVIRCSAPGWASKDVAVTAADNDGGSLQVFIEPSGARSAGGQWRVQGGTWHNTGEIQTDGLPWTQDFYVQFKDISGWLTPPNQSVLLNALTPSCVLTGSYLPASQGVGSVTITLLPTNAVSAGARWRVDGGVWRRGDEAVNGLSTGNHTIEFNAITGFVRPANQTVNINGGNTTTNLGIYSASSLCTYVSPGQSIQTAIDNATSGQTVILNDGTFTISSAISLGKGIVLRSLNGPTSCTISKSGDRGQCLTVGHADAFVDGVSLTGADNGQTGNGGGVVCSSGTLLNCRFYGNIAGYGGGAWCGNTSCLYNCVAENNQAWYGGGGVYLSGNARAYSCVLKNSTVLNDYAGGGFYAEGGLVYNCLVTGNGTGTHGDGAGGAGYNVVVQRCVIAGNTAHDSGGGLWLGDGAVVTDCIIENNTANNGAGGGFYTLGSSGIWVLNSRVRGNRATAYYAGGGWCSAATTISNCVITGNICGQKGGALASYERFSVFDTVISTNSAGAEGGAIYTENGVNLVNCLITRNSAAGDGGALWVYDSGSSSAKNTTICSNQSSGRGGGIYHNGNPNRFSLRNCICINNTATVGNPNYFEWSAGDLIFTSSCTSPLHAGIGNMNSNPLFVNLGSGDFHLQSVSPCVDRGDGAGAPDHDLDGVPRPVDGDGVGGPQVDMGAYEYTPPSGSVIVRIDPVYAVDAGGKWALDGTNWFDSEARVDYVTPGYHSISFEEASGWASPAALTISVVAGQVLATNCLYLPQSNDTDSDGLPDGWETSHFGRLTNASFASDFDGDHLTDYYEYLSGTDPRDPNSCAAFDRSGITRAPAGGVLLRWYSGSGMSYRLLRSTNLAVGFEPLDTNVVATPPMNFYTDPTAAGSGPYFYRVQMNR